MWAGITIETFLHIGNGVPRLATEVKSFLVNPAQACAVFGCIVDVSGNLEGARVAVVVVANIDITNLLFDHRGNRGARWRLDSIGGHGGHRVYSVCLSRLGDIDKVAAVEQWRLIYFRHPYLIVRQERIPCQCLLIAVIIIGDDIVGQHWTIGKAAEYFIFTSCSLGFAFRVIITRLIGLGVFEYIESAGAGISI